MKNNISMLTKHRGELHRLLSEAAGTGGGVPVQGFPVGLDDDLMIAFNDVAGESLPAQLVILQIQTNRKLDKLVDLLQKETPKIVDTDETGPSDHEG